MTHDLLRQRLYGVASSCALLSALLVLTPYSQDSSASSLPTASLPFASQADQTLTAPPLSSHPVEFWGELDLHPSDAWERLRASFAWSDQWQTGAGHARVQHWIDEYSDSPGNIAEITRRARPWLSWIMQQVEARNLPGEIALLPFVESSFNPLAQSHRGASGLWQIMPRTGDALGLIRNRAWDGRLDVLRSTDAALDYIELQADQWYDGNIELSLAAYNAGAGTVNRARRVAQAQGKQGSYWDLNLPNETMDYVPKLLAIAAIISAPDRYGVSLPDIHGGPVFARVPVTRRISLNKAAELTGVPLQRLKALNPGLQSGIAAPPHVNDLLVPRGQAEPLMAFMPPGHARDHDVHVVKRGDTLSSIAAQHAVAMTDLVRWNRIDQRGTLQPGQQLTLSER